MDKVKFDRKLTIRLNEETYQKLKEKTEELGITQSEYLRQVILKGRAVKKCKNLPSLILHLSLIGNNINQLTRRIHQAHNQGIITSEQYDLLLDELMQINNNLKALTDDY